MAPSFEDNKRYGKKPSSLRPTKEKKAKVVKSSAEEKERKSKQQSCQKKIRDMEKEYYQQMLDFIPSGLRGNLEAKNRTGILQKFIDCLDEHVVEAGALGLPQAYPTAAIPDMDSEAHAKAEGAEGG